MFRIILLGIAATLCFLTAMSMANEEFHVHATRPLYFQWKSALVAHVACRHHRLSLIDPDWIRDANADTMNDPVHLIHITADSLTDVSQLIYKDYTEGSAPYSALDTTSPSVRWGVSSFSPEWDSCSAVTYPNNSPDDVDLVYVSLADNLTSAQIQDRLALYPSARLFVWKTAMFSSASIKEKIANAMQLKDQLQGSVVVMIEGSVEPSFQAFSANNADSFTSFDTTTNGTQYFFQTYSIFSPALFTCSAAFFSFLSIVLFGLWWLSVLQVPDKL